MVGSGARAVARCDALKRPPFSQNDDMLFRPYLSDAHRAALDQLTAWMTEAGMTVRLDPAGNLIGRYEAQTVPAKSLIIASHIDSVRDGGAYDGPLGVMLGIEVVAALAATHRRLPFAVEVMAFGDEEGSRFAASMLCSRAVAGQVERAMLEVTDREGIPLAEALERAGLNIDAFLDARRDPSEWLGYLEAHIEQGPVLEAEGLALGVVTAIACQLRYEVAVTGIAGHAGTNSMALRKDALTAAAEMVLAIETVGRKGPDDLVATVGRMSVGPGAPNVVPGEVVFTIDVRAGAVGVRDRAADEILCQIKLIAQDRQVGCEHRLIHDLPASPCDPVFMNMLSDAVVETGQRPRRLVSGAGHDAMAFCGITPVAMLFIRCEGGISHNPLEAVKVSDVDAALKAMLSFVLKLESNYMRDLAE